MNNKIESLKELITLTDRWDEDEDSLEGGSYVISKKMAEAVKGLTYKGGFFYIIENNSLLIAHLHENEQGELYPMPYQKLAIIY